MPSKRRPKGTPRPPAIKVDTDEQLYSTEPALDEQERAVPSSADEPHSLQPSSLGRQVFETSEEEPERGTGLGAGGQAGSLQNISREEFASTESVAELLEEGQTHEAEVVSGVEKAATDTGEVRTREPGHDSSSAPESTTL